MKSSVNVSKLMSSVPSHLVLPLASGLTSRVARVLGANPHAMTLGGSNTYLIGDQTAFGVQPSEEYKSLQIASDSPFVGKKYRKQKGEVSNEQPLVILVDSGEGRALFPPLVNFALSRSGSSPILGGIYLTHWHGDHVGGVCDVLMDVKNTLRLAFNTADTGSRFPIFKRDGKVMPNETLHRLLSTQLKVKIENRLTLIDSLLSKSSTQSKLDLHFTPEQLNSDLWQMASKYCLSDLREYPLLDATIVENERIQVYIGADDLKVEREFLQQLKVPEILDPTSASVVIGCGKSQAVKYHGFPEVGSNTTGVKQLGMFTFSADTNYSVLSSPGHTDDHTLLFSHEERSLFTADTVLGGYAAEPSPKNPSPQPITTAFTCYADYMSTLQSISSSSKVIIKQGDADIPLSSIQYIYPGHGQMIHEGKEHRVDFYIAHRTKREQQVLACLKDVARSTSLFLNAQPHYSETSAAGLVDTIYQGAIPFGSSLVSAAQNNVLHILRKLHKQGLVTMDSEDTSLIENFLAEKDYPLQLTQRSVKPSNDEISNDIFASLDGAGESPPPQDGKLSLAEAYTLQLVWRLQASN